MNSKPYRGVNRQIVAQCQVFTSPAAAAAVEHVNITARRTAVCSSIRKSAWLFWGLQT
jgi:hypothetical protein